MKNAKSLNAKDRYRELGPALDRAFEFGFMIKLASGTSWNKINNQYKDDLKQAFRRMSIATYAYRFKGYSGQRFVTTGTTSGVRGTRLVLTNIVSPQENKRDEIIKLTYVTKKFGSSWKVIDILLNGSISELSVRHSEYRAILRSINGASILSKTLNKKADELISD
jgi:phospholipid transport system substrate-binding protein